VILGRVTAALSTLSVRHKSGRSPSRERLRFAGRVRWLSLVVLFAVASAPSLASADARSEFLVRLLRTSDQFRVRAQAALALARPSQDAAVVEALTHALEDSHPAVRASAAAALESVADPRALDPLRRARRDSDRDVRAAVERSIQAIERTARATSPATSAGTSAVIPPPDPGSVRYYVSIGTPGSQAPLAAPLMDFARTYINRSVSQIPGVELAPERETPEQARVAINRRRVTGYYLENRITAVDYRPDGALRVAVSVTVTSYPGRDIRSMLTGAATIPGADPSDSTKQQAIEGAFRAALRSLPQALQASAGIQSGR
jgi:hypothetical protein